ncbi:hypothetical protein GPECTOR_9g609 [Gonium pectorale]|uniref:Uncharacterized protein n=1 Tax=Gonium pectorale TaxID=33097 RepID=A0A150GRU1_GONPE|nr:hypothetical protein GPECTOR_9g609 [Gonium pectorale]|eukprot:KXZ52565.1 hypothetical protein GPECTOR_9g609 [Gonium pectorale]
MLLLTTSNALTAAHRGLYHERASRQALASELADLHRKLSFVVTTGKPPADTNPGPGALQPIGRAGSGGLTPPRARLSDASNASSIPLVQSSPRVR